MKVYYLAFSDILFATSSGSSTLGAKNPLFSGFVFL